LLTNGNVPEVNMEQRKSQEIPAQRPTRPTTGVRRTAMRVMQRKSVGIMAVYEQDPVAAQAGTRTLVFESASVCTRLSQFPEQWQLLSDDELAALRRSAS